MDNGNLAKRVWQISGQQSRWVPVARPAGRTLCTVLASGFVCVTPQLSSAADSAGSCCTDLEQRIADLEEMRARGGKQGFEIKVSGSVNHAILVWDDGARRDARIVTNENDNSTATIEGENESLGGGWSVGFVIDLDIVIAGSSDINQRPSRQGTAIEPGEVSVWVRNEQFGQLSIGLTSAKGSSGGSNEADLSATEVASYVGVSDIGGGLLLRRSKTQGRAGLLSETWGDLIDSLDDPDGNVITYSSPKIAGFAASALWGEDDVWNIGIGYTNTSLGPFSFVARAAYNKDLQGNIDKAPDDRTISGSVALLHTPSGLNFAIAGGQRQFIGLAATDAATAKDPAFFYVKAGWKASLTELGETAFYAEYGKFRDFLSQSAGTGSSSDAAIWGAGMVQHFDETGVQLYFGARHYEADVDFANKPAGRVPLSGLSTALAGVQIEF
jgi:hypothetical protein